jgi:hypothetical protein
MIKKIFSLFVFLLFIILNAILVYSQIQVNQYSQAETTNITGIASTTDQAQIDNYLNTNFDGLTWDVTEAIISQTSQNTTQRPTTYTDTGATTTNPTYAFDNDFTTYSRTEYDVNAEPNIIWNTWQSNTSACDSVTLYIDWEAEAGSDDTYQLLYSTDNGNSWQVIQSWTSAGRARANSTIDLGSIPTSGIQVRIDSSKKKGPDNAGVLIYEMWTECSGTVTNYGVSVEHNATGVSYTGTLKSVNVSVNFTSTLDDTYQLYIYDFVNNVWDITPCQNQNILANNYYTLWCNVTTNPTNYISGNGKISIRLNSTEDSDQGTLKEEYVQFYISSQVSDIQPPTWNNMVTNAPTNYDFNTKTIFNITWQDNVQVDTVIIEGNWSGAPINYSMFLFEGTTSNGVWSYNETLPAGNFYWKSYANDTSNNWNVSDVNYFSIAKADPTANMVLTASPSWTVTYPTETTVQGSETNNGDADLTYNLYRNNSLVSNPETILLGAGTYEYIFNTSGGQNYTSGSISNILTVNKAPTETYLYINGTRADKVVGVGGILNFTVATNVSGRNVELWTNYTDGIYKKWDGPSLEPLENITTMDTLGTFIFTGNFSGDQNYTGSTESWIVTVQLTTPQWKNNKTSPTSPVLYIPGASYQFNVTWSDDIGISTVFIEHNFTGSLINETMQQGNSINGGYEYYYNIQDLGAGTYVWRSYANDTDNQWNVTDQWIYIIKKRPIKVYQWLQVTNWTNTNITYELTIIVYNNDSITFSNIHVVPDNKFGSSYIISNLAPGQENKTILVNISNRPNQDEWFNVSPAVISTNVTGQSNKIDTILPIDPPSKLGGYLEVNLITPDPTALTSIIQNSTFWVNASVTCRQALIGCGEVTGIVRYNLSSAYPDTPINTTFGDKPFFVNETPASAIKSCGNLGLDQTCTLTWLINATGDVGSSWKIGVLFNSSSANVQTNHTNNATVSIISCVVDMTTQFNSIDFGELNPNTQQNPALNNSQNYYNITVNQGSCNLDLYIKATDLTNSSLTTYIGVGNLTYSNTSNSYTESFNLTKTYQAIKLNVAPVNNVTTWYWINVPPVYAGYYNGTIYITGVRVGELP